jgi:MFS family permease
VVGLAVLAVLTVGGFVRAERRAAEPVLPPHLFRNPVFLVTSAMGLVVGFALFGALTFLPLFQQTVRGSTPTESGLQLLPVMAGLLTSSITSGQVISRTGVYKPWPIAGTAITTAGLLLLSGLDRHTSGLLAAVYMGILGLGLGMIMQVLVLAVQNAVPYEELGVATSGATLFRSIGGSLGTAVLGAVFANKVHGLEAVENPIDAFTGALTLVFLVAACVAFVAFALSWTLPQRPLRSTVSSSSLEHVFAAPDDADAVRVVTRALGAQLGREGVVAFLRAAAERAAVDVSPMGGFLLYRAGTDGSLDVGALAQAHHLDPDAARDACRSLHAQGLLTGGPQGSTGLTAEGAQAVDALAAARLAALEELAAEWEPGEHPELESLLRELADDLAEQPG